VILCIGDLLARVGRCGTRASSRTICSVIYAWRRGFRRTTHCGRSESSSAKLCGSCRRLSVSFMRERAGRRFPGTAVANRSAPGVLYGRLVDGAARVQSSVLLVRRPVDGRRRLGCYSFLQEPGSPAARRYCARVHDLFSIPLGHRSATVRAHFSGLSEI
jgi:hypothetical protein